MKYLFIDTETTGILNDKELSLVEINNMPRLVSVAYIMCDEREIVDKDYFIIKPNGFIIPPESINIHGITTAEAVSKGVPISVVLETIKPIIEKCDYIVGHNVSFDINVLNAEYYRYNKTLPVSLKPSCCTMMLSKDICNLPNKKYPSLEELQTILKGESISNAHNAMADTQAAMDCFWILKDSGIVNSEIEKPTIKIYPTEDNIAWAGEHVSNEYVNKVHAFLAIACNLKNNKSNFLRSKSSSNSDLEFVETWLDNMHPGFERIIDPNSNNEWINNIFNFFYEELNKSSASVRFSKFDGSRTVALSSIIREIVKDIENEVGFKNLIEEFQLKCPESTSANLILIEESSWIDIAIEAVNKKLQLTDSIENTLPPYADAEIYFKSMIDYVNNLRDNELMKRVDEMNKRLEKSLNQIELVKNRDVIKNYSSPNTSSSGGCMALLSLFVGISSSLCFLIAFLL